MYPQKQVYLAGPIVGVGYGEARFGWRQQFATMVRDEESGHAAAYPHIHFYSPMRGRRIMDENDTVAPGVEFVIDDPLENAKSMLARDTNDVRNADMVVVNLLGAKRAALGTTAEMGFAFALRVPILLIMEKDPSIFHHHGFIIGMADYHVETLKEAAYVVQTILTPGV